MLSSPISDADPALSCRRLLTPLLSLCVLATGLSGRPSTTPTLRYVLPILYLLGRDEISTSRSLITPSRTHAVTTTMQEIYKKYHSKGLEILAFPSNQFGVSSSPS